MSLIKNLIKETEKKPHKNKKDAADATEDDEKVLRPVVKTATDLQRLKLEKLMKNPEKPVIIPEPRREKDYMASVPTFVRNVMGSSAGAGSGEFHVYRHLRRKEYARQKTIQAQSAREEADDAYQKKLDDNRLAAEGRTAKKRAKRLKRKERAKKPREQRPKQEQNDVNESSDSNSEEEQPEQRSEEHKEESNDSKQQEPNKEEPEQSAKAESEPDKRKDASSENKQLETNNEELERPKDSNKEEATAIEDESREQDKNELPPAEN